MDQYGFLYEVKPLGARSGGPPLKPHPLLMVGWREDALYQQLTQERSKRWTPLTGLGFGKLMQSWRRLPARCRLREWVNKGGTVYIKAI